MSVILLLLVIVYFCGNDGLGRNVMSSLIVVFGLVIRWSVVVYIFCGLCGGRYDDRFMVMLLVLLTSRCGKVVGSTMGFFVEFS